MTANFSDAFAHRHLLVCLGEVQASAHPDKQQSGRRVVCEAERDFSDVEARAEMLG